MLLPFYAHVSRPFWTGQPLAYPAVQKSGAAADTPTEIRELALAHVSGDKVASAYQRSVLLEKRRTLMERWGRFCAGGEGKIVELRPAIVA